MTNRLDSRHRAEQAARMSATGATWQEIADALGYRSRQAASQAVKRLHDRTPPETVEQARAKHDTALQLLQRNDFTRYLLALQNGDDDTALRYSKELRGIVSERAKLAGVYAPERQQVDVNVTTDAVAIIDRMEAELLALVAQRPPQQALPANAIIEAEVVPA
ncbi:AraC family transcriptional regulator [Mycolicibacterium fortuitum]|uniref:AraC family transcriptional regulator n=1 Tax=Mycobacteriaceae TaxID=1762 RepID=UPI0009C09E5C|nr:AraC family transcriptional regulator [Mycolicibacterium fortuitum]UHJ54410.1 AraC family transcriptional regulator [Mycolicibacterium fortuitum]